MASSAAPIVIRRTPSMICKPLGDGSMRCDPVVNPDDSRILVVVLVIISLVIVGVLIHQLWNDWKFEKAMKEKRKKMEEDLSKTVSERISR